MTPKRKIGLARPPSYYYALDRNAEGSRQRRTGRTLPVKRQEVSKFKGTVSTFTLETAEVVDLKKKTFFHPVKRPPPVKKRRENLQKFGLGLN